MLPLLAFGVLLPPAALLALHVARRRAARPPSRRGLALALALTAALVAGYLPLPAAQAAPGDYVASVTFSAPCGSGLGVGIAFDGSHLWYSCYGASPDLYRADPVSGFVVGTYNVCGGLGALSYDRSADVMYAGWGGGSCGPFGSVLRITHDPATKAVLASGVLFTPSAGGATSLLDGLAYDPATDVHYLSPDGSTTIYTYDSAGTFLGSFPWAGTAGCYNSGLAMAGLYLYQGANGCSRVYAVQKTPSPPSVVAFSFSTLIPGDPNARDEDLECDDVTFAASGKEVIWSKEAYAPMRASAFEVPAGSCRQEGVEPKPPTPVSTCSAYGALVRERDATGVVGDLDARRSWSRTRAVNDSLLSPEAPTHPSPIPRPAAHADAEMEGYRYVNTAANVRLNASIVHSWCDSGFIGPGQPDAFGRAGVLRLNLDVGGTRVLDAKAIEFEAEAILRPAGVSYYTECEIVEVGLLPPPPLASWCPSANTIVNVGVPGVTVTVTLNEQFTPFVNAAGELVMGGAAVHVRIETPTQTIDVWLGLVYVCLTNAPPPPPPPECPIVDVGGGEPVQANAPAPRPIADALNLLCDLPDPCDFVAAGALCDRPPCEFVINLLGQAIVVNCNDPPIDCIVVIERQAPVLQCEPPCQPPRQGDLADQAVVAWECVPADPCDLLVVPGVSPCHLYCKEFYWLDPPQAYAGCTQPVVCSGSVDGKGGAWSIECGAPIECGAAGQGSRVVSSCAGRDLDVCAQGLCDGVLPTLDCSRVPLEGVCGQ